MADISQVETGKQIRRLKFLNTEHSDENTESILKGMEGEDVILFEFVSDQETKDFIEELINLAASTNDAEEKKEAIAVIKSEIDSELFGSVAEQIIRHGQELHLIDSTFGTPEQKKAQIAKEAIKLAIDLYYEGEYDDSFSEFKSFATNIGQSSIKREPLVSAQIKELIGEHNWVDKKILVIQGASHSSVYHHFKNQNENIRNVSRTFPSKPYVFDLGSALARKIAFGKTVSYTDFLRAFLANFPISDELMDRYGAELNNQDITRRANKLALKMTDRQVEEYWGRFKRGEIDQVKLVDDLS